MTSQAQSIIGVRIRVRGLVQGVGFRPHVWRLAREYRLAGLVKNDGAGVEIEVWGLGSDLVAFQTALKSEAPPLARISSISDRPIDGPPPVTEFSIVESASGNISTGIVPDAATCPECLAEIVDPLDRRFGYAFSNCTHCGPRLSIIRSIPYDRPNTSMGSFQMCEACSREYEDPGDRRFHAQPNACPECGPHIWLEDRRGRITCADPLDHAASMIGQGAIVAIKGIGGFHLACDATNNDAVNELRLRKKRAAKPLALMAASIEQIGRYCRVSEPEEALLKDRAAPIVLLEKKTGELANGTAPGQDRIGFMLPYTPLHHLLMARLANPAVMTSGNLSDEPQATGNADARERLSQIADLWVMHDREIVNRLDDSVMRVDKSGPQILRRARGLAPEPVQLHGLFEDAPPVLALGGELKSTFCLLRRGEAVLSQHMGDLEDAAVRADYRKNLTLYRDIFRFDPEVIAVDVHPDYASSRQGRALADETGAVLVTVQHHHAHLASVLAEHRIEPGDDHCLGIVLDGLGFGDDGTIWGGELLVGGYDGYERVAHFNPVALPGGDLTMREPWRNTVAHLGAAFGEEWMSRLAQTPLASRLSEKPLTIVGQMIDKGVNAPLSSSAGRLFDGVAAALGVCFDRQHYEGQAAMEMEAMARPHIDTCGHYPVAIDVGETAVLSWAPLWRGVIDDLQNGVEAGVIAARFHTGLSTALARLAEQIVAERGLSRVVLSGGVMQNRILLEQLHDELQRRGLEVLVHRLVPANDGGLSLGQSAVAATCCR
ncbi:carbamoyltransferase HypF [Hoeflea sp. TYP-13]|uniref:carbamoyltransferase HypF n=1 Tax=Hoeflea sp. TYP-13 TaxID=3230023 RepID=UPI0034C69B6F